MTAPGHGAPPSNAGPTPVFQRLAIIGAGHQGSSVALAARARGGMAAEVVIYDAAPAVRDRASALGLAHRVAPTIADAVVGADCVMLCVPVGVMAAVATEMAPHLASGAIVTDVGSTKLSVIQDVAPLLPAHVHFVPAHPMAGTELSGPDSGLADLYVGRYVLVVPLPGTPPGPVARITRFWQAAGSVVDQMDATHHDRAIAMVSHLPHLIAFTICGMADTLDDEGKGEVLKYAASGFRDFTRIAASNPVMWRDIFLNNKVALLEMLDRFTADAARMATAIRTGDGTYIEQQVERGRTIRQGLIEANQA